MRRSEISKELIELSKRAKELGFPQDVDEGDWGNIQDYHGKFFITLITEEYTAYPYLGKNDFLILSFSRCLSWLKLQDNGVCNDFVLISADEGYWIERANAQDEDDIFPLAKTHHEAISKAVCKILEEEK